MEDDESLPEKLFLRARQRQHIFPFKNKVAYSLTADMQLECWDNFYRSVFKIEPNFEKRLGGRLIGGNIIAVVGRIETGLILHRYEQEFRNHYYFNGANTSSGNGKCPQGDYHITESIKGRGVNLKEGLLMCMKYFYDTGTHLIQEKTVVCEYDKFRSGRHPHILVLADTLLIDDRDSFGDIHTLKKPKVINAA